MASWSRSPGWLGISDMQSRSLRRSPAMAIAAIATLAMGIGANTAIFSVLEGVVLKPLPFPQPDRLVTVALFNRTLGYATYLSYPDFVDWQRNAGSFEQIAAFRNDGFDLTAFGPECERGDRPYRRACRSLRARRLEGRETPNLFLLLPASRRRDASLP